MENNIIAVFNNRNKSMQFASYLKRMGIPNKTVNTPRDLSVSCGISVIFNSKYLQRARAMMFRLAIQDGVKLFIIYNGKNYRPI